MPEYLEGRYCDLKQIIEACISYFPPKITGENYLFGAMVCEFNLLAEELGFEDMIQFLERLCKNLEEGGDA